jgi:hypothetical protein
VILVIAFAAGVWFVSDGAPPATQDPESARFVAPAVPDEAPLDTGPEPAREPERRAEVSSPAPVHRIAENGRLSIDLETLQEGDVLVLGLALPDEVHVDQPLPAKIVSLEQGLLETTAFPDEGSGNGLRLEIDSDWLTPGGYMIQIATPEKKPLSARRWVLKVR